MREVQKSTVNGMSKKMIVIGVVAAAFAVLGAWIYNMPSNRLVRQLDLGQKYLEDCDYEQAKLAFEKAIKIDPMEMEAYLGLAEVYVNQENMLSALETLEKGYELTGEEAVCDKMTELFLFFEEENEEILSKLENTAYSKQSCSSYLTDEEFKELWSPYLPVLEKSLMCDEDQVLYNLSDMLAEYYLAAGDYEKCLEIRRKLWEKTGHDSYEPKEHEVERNGDKFFDDEYGRTLGINYADGRIASGEYNASEHISFQSRSGSHGFPDGNGGFVEYVFDFKSYSKCDAEGRICEWIAEDYLTGTDILVEQQHWSYEYYGDKVKSYGFLSYINEEYTSNGFTEDKREGTIDEFGEVTWIYSE